MIILSQKYCYCIMLWGCHHQFCLVVVLFSSSGPKGHVSFCHHFTSGVVVHICKLFIFSSSSLKPLNRFGPNLVEMFICEKLLNKLNILQYMNVPWMVLHLIYYFGTDRKYNMAARANNVFWLVETLKIFLSETTQPMEL